MTYAYLDWKNIADLVAKAKKYRRIDIICFVAIVITGIICATLFATDDKAEMNFKVAYIVLLCADIAAIVMYITFNIAFVFRNSARLKNAVRAEMYATLDREQSLFGNGDAHFEVAFEDCILRISRDGQGCAFDLNGLKGAPDAFGACGTMLFNYMAARCQLACEDGFTGDVSCTDCTGRRKVTYMLCSGGVAKVKVRDPRRVLAYGKGTEE